MEIAEDPIKAAWYNFIVRNVPEEVTVVFAEELSGRDAPRPKGSYITIEIISGPIKAGIDELRKNSTTDKFFICGMRQYTVSLQAFRSGSRSFLDCLQTVLDSPRETELLKESNIAIVDPGTVTDISELLDVGFERRHQMDVVFNSVSSKETDIGPIETVRVSGSIKEGANGTHTVEEFEVSKP